MLEFVAMEGRYSGSTPAELSRACDLRTPLSERPSAVLVALFIRRSTGRSQAVTVAYGGRAMDWDLVGILFGVLSTVAFVAGVPVLSSRH